MNIGVSAWRLAGQRLGIGRYIEYLLKHWTTMLRVDERVAVFVHEPFDRSALNLSDAFSARVIRPRLKNAIWENLLLPRAAAGVDVLFGPSYTLPLTYRGRSVVAIHSVDEVQPGALSRWHQLTYSQKYRLSAQHADKVVVNSRSVGDRVRDIYGIPEEKIEVVWLGADGAFQPIDDEELLKAPRTRYFGYDRPYVLFAGGLSMRRNVPMLIEAFAAVRREHRLPHGLLFVGPNRDNIPVASLAETFGVGDSVVQDDGKFSAHGQLAAIYNAADLYVLPSSSDGFSLTLAEALSCGTPVITVNRAALGEVAHGYALTIDEPELGALADAMRRVLTDGDLSRQLRLKSRERGCQLRWERTAQRTLDVLREVAAG